jgi:hypothetical protein
MHGILARYRSRECPRWTKAQWLASDSGVLPGQASLAFRDNTPENSMLLEFTLYPAISLTRIMGDIGALTTGYNVNPHPVQFY